MEHRSSASTSKTSKGLLASLIIAWLIFFCFGVVGHRQVGNNTTESIFKTLQLFHLHYHPEPSVYAMSKPGLSSGDMRETSPGLHSAQPPAMAFNPPRALEIARFGAALWGLALLPALVGLFFEDRILRWRVRSFWRNHVVVCGQCSRTLSLIRNLCRGGQKVVFIGHCPVPRDELSSKVLYLEANEPNETSLARAALHRASRLVALNESDRANLELLVAAERGCQIRDPGLVPLECYAHLADIHLQSGLYKAMVSSTETFIHTRPHLFNYYEISARLLACQYPLPAALAETEPYPEHFVIIGFGAFGQSVALKLAKMGQQLFRHPSALDWDEWRVRKPRITVVDPRGDACKAAFLRAHTKFTQFCELSFINCNCEEQGFIELSFLRPEDAPARTSLIFCLENEAVTLQTLLLILDVCRAPEKDVDYIYIRIAEPERLGGLLEKLQPANGRPRIVFFAPDREVFSADVLLDRNLDVLAGAIHEAWLKVEADDRRTNNLPPAAGKLWGELSEDDRQSNREAADHTWAKLRTLGYDLQRVPVDQTAPPPDPELLRELEDREEELARVEHYRWMTWRILTGWKYDKVRNNELKHHPDMIPYEQLLKTTKEKDRIIIRAIPELLKLGRLKAVKRNIKT